MTPDTTLEQQGQKTLQNPSPIEVEAALRQIDPQHRSYLILNRPDDSYIQVAGSRLKLTIEFREVQGDSFHHYVLGRFPTESRQVVISCSCGPITVQRNEVLLIEDAVRVAKEFMESGRVPEEYALRDVTGMFDRE
ncbi:hypothetical protein EON80_18070 [bacterium]|nr:MAG: hypothetical protein EON80_18070 [bacterium]